LSPYREKFVPATCYLDRLRKGLPPEDSAAAEPENVPVTPLPPTPEPAPTEAIAVDEIAAFFPSPDRPFWWFSSTPILSPRIPPGMPVRADPGARLPLEADYWCHEGDSEWAMVDRTSRPKPEPKKGRKNSRQRVAS
jgi:hypothetical protein